MTLLRVLVEAQRTTYSSVEVVSFARRTLEAEAANEIEKEIITQHNFVSFVMNSFTRNQSDVGEHLGIQLERSFNHFWHDFKSEEDLFRQSSSLTVAECVSFLKGLDAVVSFETFLHTFPVLHHISRLLL